MSSTRNSVLVIVFSIAAVCGLAILAIMYAGENLQHVFKKGTLQGSLENALKERSAPPDPDVDDAETALDTRQISPENALEERSNTPDSDVADAEVGTYQPIPKESVQAPSLQEYLLGFFAYRAAVYSITRCIESINQKEHVLRVISETPGKNEESVIENNWNVWKHSWPYMVLSLTHALMSEISPKFRLSNVQKAEVQEIIENAIDARIRKLDKLRMTWPCITTKAWFEEQCVKPGPFYTREFMEKHLLSGLHHEDLDNHNVFYNISFHEYGLPEFISHITELVEKCCKDVQIDSAVVDGIADIMSNHRLETKWIEVQSPNGSMSMLSPTQQSVDLMCGKLTALYRDAILRRVDMNTLFRITKEESLMEHSSLSESFNWLFQQDPVSD